MKTLLQNGKIVNVFTGEIQKTDVLIEDDMIIGVGTGYTKDDADVVENVRGRILCPGFIDGHIHIESTMMGPYSFAKAVLPHGTTTVITDPHEIANVCGVDGIKYMLEASENLPVSVYFMLPSCVPATPFDESGAVLSSEDLKELYDNKRVLGLAEMMNYPGVLAGDKDVLAKIDYCRQIGKKVDGHAPLLTGKELDKYISAGVHTDHECSSEKEAKERIMKGQWVMIRQGSAAKNLDALISLFDEPYSRRCLLVTDDRNPSDILEEGHIDNIIRSAAASGKSAVSAIRMATIQAAECMGIENLGAIAPGYRADILVLNKLDEVAIRDVYAGGKKVISEGKMCEFEASPVNEELSKKVKNSFNLSPLTKEDFFIEPKGEKCRVIGIVPGQILTESKEAYIDWQKGNGIDIKKDILKLAVIERHKNTGHKGLGFVTGAGLKMGAIASSVSHDSHNLIVIGASDEDMAFAANAVTEMGGGMVISVDDKIYAKVELPVAGLMSEEDVEKLAHDYDELRKVVYKLGVPADVEPFMNMAFVSLPVIPKLKMSTTGLVDVTTFQKVDLYL